MKEKKTIGYNLLVKLLLFRNKTGNLKKALKLRKYGKEMFVKFVVGNQQKKNLQQYDVIPPPTFVTTCYLLTSLGYHI